MNKQWKKVSIRNGFSDRNRINPLNTVIQYKSLDEHSRNAIAILIGKAIQDMLEHVRQISQNQHPFNLNMLYDFQHELAKELRERIFNEPVPLDVSLDLNEISNDLTSVCLKGDYDEVLSLVEKLSQIYDEYRNTKHYEICSLPIYDEFNKLFEKECIGYKFINKQICKITSQVEIESITTSLKTPHDMVNQHIKKAISFIKEIGQHDYKNSIKESVLALECLLNIVLEKNGISLGKAIDEYAERIDMHPAFKESISKLYGFSSDSPGIRHGGNKRDFNEGFDEAKLVLVNTSGFINYIISKNKND